MHNEPLVCSFAVIKSYQGLACSPRAQGECVWVHRAVQGSPLGCTTDRVPPWARCHWGVSPFHSLQGVLQQAAWSCHEGDTVRAQVCSSLSGKSGCKRCSTGESISGGEHMQEPPNHNHVPKRNRVLECIHSWLICITSRVLLQSPNATTSQVIYIFMEYLPKTS